MKWPIVWLILGCGISALLALAASRRVEGADAMMVGAVLMYVYAVSLASSIAVFILLAKYSDSFWSAFLPAVFCGLPMFGGWIPASIWLSALGSRYGHENWPSLWWLTAVMVIGFLVPGYGLRLIVGPPMHPKPRRE